MLHTSLVSRTLTHAALVAALALALGCASGAGPAGPADQASATPEEPAAFEPAPLQRPPAKRPSRGVVDKRKARSHYGLGIDHLRNGRAALAIRELRAAEMMDPGDAWIHLALAEAYRQKGVTAEAESHLERALDIDPDFQEARLNLSALYVQLERYEEALPPANELLADPTFPVPWKALTNRGWALMQLGRGAEARQDLELAVEYHPNYWQAVLNLGILEVEDGNRLEALELFDRVLALRPGPLAEAEANYRIGEIYVSLGNRERALEHLTAASAYRPSGPWGKRSEDYLKRLQ